MSTANKIVLTTAQILGAHAAHGNDFIVINFESTRKFKNYSQYIDIDIKLADGNVAPIRYWKLSNDGLIIASRIRKPEQRKYEAIRMGVALRDEEGNDNDNTTALHLLCVAFEEKMQQFKQENVITDDARAAKRQADGTYRPFHLISTKIVSPMQTTAKDKESDDMIDLENPLFWLSIPKKKFFGNGETARPSIHYEDKFYADENGQPDLARPIMTHQYAPEFFNIDDFYHHARTGKKHYKHLGDIDEETDDNYLDNTNVQNYLTRGSAIMGNLKFELAVSGRQCKLEIALYARCYVKVADRVEGGSGGQDDESIDAFASRYSSIGGKKQATRDGDDEYDFEEE